MDEKMGGFIPLFKRPEMVKDVSDKGETIEERINAYQDTILDEGWNGGAVEGLLDVIEEIRSFVKDYKEKAGQAELPSLEAKFNEAMEQSKHLYAAAALQMKDEQGWDKIIEICKSMNANIVNKGSHKLQSATEIAPLYTQAKEIQKDFELMLKKHAQKTNTLAIPAKMKKLYRLIEKLVLKSDLGCAAIRDVVRGTILCGSNEEIAKVLESLAQDKETITITNVKDGHADYTEGAWVDVKVIAYMKKNYNRHKFEIQIVHEKMMKMRETQGGHHTYSTFRSLGELVEDLKRDQGGVAELVALEKKIEGLVQNNRTDAVLRIAHSCTQKVMVKVKDDANINAMIANYDAQLPLLFQKRDFAQCAAIQQKINELQSQAKPKMVSNTDLAAGKGVTLAVEGEDPNDLSYLTKLYPSVPLSEYVNEGNFWHINKEYPGLQCISKDPFIFLVHNLLTTEQCRNLIIKGGNHFARSRTSGNVVDPNAAVRDSRTSCDVRVPFNEVPTLQGIFSEVLNAPVSQFEPLKLIRYEDGQYFKPHHDAGGVQHLAPRRITLFVYLSTCDAGGETHFTKYGLKIKPRAGLGVIHFPSRLSTAKGLRPAKKWLSSTKYVKGAKVRISKTLQIGTVKNATGKDAKSVTVGIDGEEEKNECLFEGTLAQLQEQIPIMSSLGGVRDERLIHEGMPAVGEKFLASQWVFEGKVEASALLENYSVTPLGGKML